jgi:MBG domain (YGX type)/Bacterial Ig-like domain (group 3)/FG-GAP-like repeat/FG-GAP repeat
MHVVSVSTPGKVRVCLLSAGILAMLVFSMICAPTAKSGTTTTTLALSSSSVTSGTVVTFTATVSNGAAVTTGLVSFCDATAAFCENPSVVIGTAQLTSVGTAVIKLVPGLGSHTYKAIFNGTKSNGASTSSVQSLVVIGAYSTMTSISNLGAAGNYTLRATAVGAGSTNPLMTGNVSFADTTNGNFVLGSMVIGSPSSSQSFGTQVAHAIQANPISTAIGDFNGDGLADMAVVNSGGSTVSVLLGNGDGTFQPQVAYATGTDPYSVAVGDFNGDGKLDLAVANNVSGTVSVLLGNGDGTFQTQATYTVAVGADSVAVGDFNRDGKADLVVARYNQAEVSVLLGRGDGTFQPQVTYAAGIHPYSAVVADLNGDGKLDLIVANSGSNTVSVLFGNGDGTFQTQVTYATGSNPQVVVVADLNGDGRPDLVVANFGSNTVSVLAGNGDGTLQAQVTYAVGSGPESLAVGDFNNDTAADVVVGNLNSNTVSVLSGKGNGTLLPQVTYATGANPHAVAVGDFSGDGNSDLAVANFGDNTVSVLLNSVTQKSMATIPGISIPGTGSHLVDAVYSGDANFSTSTSSTVSLIGSPVTTALALAASPTFSTYGQLVILTATLSPSTEGNLTTSGESVSFKSGTVTLGAATLSALGVATLTITTMPAGINSLTAVYSGDANFLTSTSSALSFTATPAVLTVTANNAIRAFGAANPSFTSTITGFVNGDTQASATSGAPGLTTWAITSSPAGNYAITAAVGTLSAANYTFLFVNGTLEVTVPRNMQFVVQGINETVPNAYPVSSPGFGSSDAPCAYSQSSNPSLICYNPLQIAFDLNLPAVVPSTATNIPQATLGIVNGDPTTNILFLTNSLDSVNGGSVTTTASCDATGSVTSLTIVGNMDDGSTFTFSATSGKCDFSQPISGTFTSTSSATPGDSGTFVLTPYNAINGSYQGGFDSSGNPLSAGGTGTATFNITTNSDYTVNATATLPAGSLCAAQTSPILLTTADPLAQINGLGAGISGAANGNYLDLPMGDGNGTVTWMIAEGYDGTTDQNLSWPSQLYFSTYTITGICGGQFAWDKVFTLEHSVSRHPVRPDPISPRAHRHNWLPRRWRRAMESPTGVSNRNWAGLKASLIVAGMPGDQVLIDVITTSASLRPEFGGPHRIDEAEPARAGWGDTSETTQPQRRDSRAIGRVCSWTEKIRNKIS